MDRNNNYNRSSDRPARASGARPSGSQQRRASDYGERRASDGRRVSNDSRRTSGSRNVSSRNGYSAGRSRSGSGGRRRGRNARQKRNKMIVSIIVIIVIIAMVVVGIVSLLGNGNNSKEESTTTAASDTETTETTADAASSSEITLLAVGDIIGHETILNLANTGNGYDFTSLFAPLKSDISSVDIAVANMETPFGGTESGAYAGYPNFNTPDEMGDAIIDAGFDVVQLASNHTMDSGTSAIDHELNYWKNHSSQVLAVGVYGSEEERNSIPILEKDGVKIAFLNYTFSLNGYELPEDHSYALTLLTDDNKDFIKSQITQASQEADFVVVLPHWGTEYEVGEPTSEQVSWAELFTEAGADLIIGTHPHVIEKIDWVESGGNKALCYYSLGNFVSNQQYTNTVLGAMAYVVLNKDTSGVSINEEKTKVIPVVTHNDKTGETTKIATYYLADYTDEMASVHDTKLSYESDFSVSKMQGIVDEVYDSSWLKDRVN